MIIINLVEYLNQKRSQLFFPVKFLSLNYSRASRGGVAVSGSNNADSQRYSFTCWFQDRQGTR